MPANRNSIAIPVQSRSSLNRHKPRARVRREDHLLLQLLASGGESELAPGGSRDWGNSILSDGGLLGSSYERAY